MDAIPFGVILDSLVAGKVVPFLGAAASRLDPEPGDDSPLLPSGLELAKMLARDAAFPWDDERDVANLAMVSSYYVDVSPDRDLLRGKLRKIFSHTKYKCNRLHRLLADVARQMLILTTNYDTLIEQAFEEAGNPFDLYVYPADNAEYKNALLWWRHGATEPITLRPNEIDVEELRGRNVIYKIHGSVKMESRQWDSFVITEEDYIDFLSRMSSRANSAVPSAFKTYFTDRSFLFLGYGLKDWNLRVLLKQLGMEKQSWAILHEPSEIDQKMWGKRNVEIYDSRLEAFVDGMRHARNQTATGTHRPGAPP